MREAGDPLKAATMQAYMKSAMPYHGVPTPLLRRIFKMSFADVQFANAAQWRGQVLDLWRKARYREERYAALHLAGDRRAQAFRFAGDFDCAGLHVAAGRAGVVV